MTDLSVLPEPDREAIASTLLALLEGLKERNANALANVYSHDADWTNGFGTVKRGAAEIVDYFRGLFRDEHFTRNRLAGPPDTTFRVVTRDVVLVSAHVILHSPDGEGRQDCDRYALRVLQRQHEGTWRVISEVFPDPDTMAYQG